MSWIKKDVDTRIQGFALKSLFFADDALLLSHSLEEARENLEIITNTSRVFGL